MTTSTVTPEIVEFAQGVRAALADLPAEEVDDLTEGLEADLAEAYAEDLQRELPDPAAYATELRAAAGLPLRAKAAKSGVLSSLKQGWKDTRADLAVAIRRNPALASAAEFLVTLRPVWWITRAWLAAWLVASFFGNERGYGMAGTWWLVFAAFVVVSVQWGRGHWHGNGVPALIAIGNVVAVLVLVPVFGAASSWDGNNGGYYSEPVPASADSKGITLEGKSVTNIFAYDAEGKPLKNVQLFDQDGRPMVAHLDPVRDECFDGTACTAGADGQTFAPSKIETGASVSNVFPLSLVGTVLDNETGEPTIDPTAVPQLPKAPFIKVPAVLTPEKVAKSND
jgi:hypothetical protein